MDNSGCLGTFNFSAPNVLLCQIPTREFSGLNMKLDEYQLSLTMSFTVTVASSNAAYRLMMWPVPPGCVVVLAQLSLVMHCEIRGVHGVKASCTC